MEALLRELKDAGRGVAGALVFGMPFLLTMETWWLGWTLPIWVLLPTAFVGILLVLVLVRVAGFRRAEETRRPAGVLDWLAEAAEVVTESLLAAYIVLSLYGIVDWGDPFVVTARVGLMQILALGLGAALANRLLTTEDGGAEARPFPAKLGLFSLGALFFILHLAPTEEMEYLAAQAGWTRLGLLLAAAVLLGYLMLFELEFRGQAGRTGKRTRWLRVGEGFLVVTIALVISAAILAAFGHFTGQPPEAWVQMTIVLAFPGTVGAGAARLVLG